MWILVIGPHFSAIKGSAIERVYVDHTPSWGQFKYSVFASIHDTNYPIKQCTCESDAQDHAERVKADLEKLG